MPALLLVQGINVKNIFTFLFLRLPNARHNPNIQMKSLLRRKDNLGRSRSLELFTAATSTEL